MYDAVIVGGGAAGLMCAGFLSGLRVAVADRNRRPARKVLITGKGRCNLTNDCEPDEFLRFVRTNPRFMYSAVNRFPPRETMALFESLGVPLKTERGRRVFPESDKAPDVVDALAKHARGSDYITARCSALLFEDGRVAGVVCDDGRKLLARAVVIATGGLSYPRTGSTGDGYTLAASAGHGITRPRASLVPVITREKWAGELAGLGLKNIRLDILRRGAGKPVFSEQGELLFTHEGISGPLTLSASAHMEPELMEEYTAVLDLKPALDMEKLDARLLRDFAQFSARELASCLRELMPRALIAPVLAQCGLQAHIKISSVTREQRLALAGAVKGLRLTPSGFAPIDEAIITSGGVEVKGIDPKTMCSKLVKGLYFAGEVIDVDAYTGGFNLQIAFSTGRAAARGIKLHALGRDTMD